MKYYLLFEMANSHGGSVEYIYSLLGALPKKKNTGIKFQVFKYDELALKDYQWYPVYKKLYISEKKWGDIFSYGKQLSFDLWIDVFDSYSLFILKKNIKKITGIKLQSSVLENLHLLNQLKQILNKRKMKIIINVAGREINEIKKIKMKFQKLHPSSEIIVQVGFQNYPSSAQESLLNKITKLKTVFPDSPIAYADHSNGASDLSLKLPIYAFSLGANLVEKHVCSNRKKTKYDYHSAIEPRECKALINDLEEYKQCVGKFFSLRAEKKYLQKTAEKPIANEKFHKGGLIQLEKIAFKRTAQNGISVHRLIKFMRGGAIVKDEIPRGAILTEKNFRQSRIGVFIACRMKSTRLKQKAILPIGNYTAIERCIMNCKKIASADKIVLATSRLPEDKILKKYAIKNNISFFAGDPDDVMRRYADAAKKYSIDVIIRVTGDCPVVSHEVAEHLLKKHFETGADYTAPRKFPVGINSEIYNVSALKKILYNLKSAPLSEYMTWYLINNPEFFKVNIVDLPKEYLRSYRLTLDVQEDLDMFQILFKKLGSKEPNIKNIYHILDNNPKIAQLNKSIQLTYKTDKKLINLLNKKTKIKFNK